MKVKLYTKVPGGPDELREHEWLCVGCGSPEVVNASGCTRCWDCHGDAIGVYRGYISNDEYIARTAKRSDREKLRTLSERIAALVGDVRCYVTEAEANERDRLETTVGEKWDATNRRWCPLDS